MFEHMKDIAEHEKRIERTLLPFAILVVLLVALGLMFGLLPEAIYLLAAGLLARMRSA